MKWILWLGTIALSVWWWEGCGGGNSTAPPPPSQPQQALQMNVNSLPSGMVQQRYGIATSSGTSFTLSAFGGVTPYVWSWVAASGSSLPPGLSLVGGAIEGTPTTAGSYTVVLTVNDAEKPAAHQSATFTIAISAAPAPLAIVLSTPPPGTYGQNYGSEQSELVSCIWSPVRGWHFQCIPCTGSSPTCQGLPPCRSPFPTSRCYKTETVFTTFSFAATGGLQPYIWNWAPASGSALPSGLTLNRTTGVVSGTPQAPGSFQVVVTAGDSGNPGTSQSENCTFVIAPPPPPAINADANLPIGTVNVAYVEYTFAAINGAPPYTWTETSGLPTGMTVTNLGILSGTPAQTGNFTFTVGLQDALQETASQNFTVEVLANGFVPTGSMEVKRDWPTATLLQNGQVLVTGGVNATAFPTTAELYDPGTGKFTPTTGSLSGIRFSATATLLPSGKVLLAGGKGANDVVATGELYDPATQMFVLTTGNMTTARVYHAATLLKDGTVLLTGGLDSAGNLSGLPVSTAEIYDPATGQFTATASLSTGRFFHTATLLGDGTVLITGGLNGGALASAELYDPTAKTFTVIGNMTTGRTGHAATLLSDGRVLLTGGSGSFSGNSLNTAEIYDPTAKTFSATNMMTSARSQHSATLLNNGQVLVAGGSSFFYGSGNSNSLSASELFDPTSGNFTRTADMTVRRESHLGTLLPNGKVLVTGGSDGTLGYSTTTVVHLSPELY